MQGGAEMSFVATQYVFKVKLSTNDNIRVELNTRNFPKKGMGKGFYPGGFNREEVEFDYEDVLDFEQMDPGLV